MVLIWVIIGILSNAGVMEPDSSLIWHWFGHHVFLTVLMLIFLG
jgi:hypothetical protein